MPKGKKKQSRGGKGKSSTKGRVITFRLNEERYQNIMTLRAFYTQKYREEGIIDNRTELSNSAVGRLAFDFLYEYTLIQMNKGNDGTTESRIPLHEGKFTFIEDNSDVFEKLTEAGKKEMRDMMRRENDEKKPFVEVEGLNIDWDNWDSQKGEKKPAEKEVLG